MKFKNSLLNLIQVFIVLLFLGQVDLLAKDMWVFSGCGSRCGSIDIDSDTEGYYQKTVCYNDFVNSKLVCGDHNGKEVEFKNDIPYPVDFPNPPLKILSRNNIPNECRVTNWNEKTILGLFCENITDIKFLSKFKKINSLYLFNSSANLMVLEQLKNLERLYLIDFKLNKSFKKPFLTGLKKFYSSDPWGGPHEYAIKLAYKLDKSQFKEDDFSREIIYLLTPFFDKEYFSSSELFRNINRLILATGKKLEWKVKREILRRATINGSHDIEVICINCV